jgi:hypothetical protein
MKTKFRQIIRGQAGQGPVLLIIEVALAVYILIVLIWWLIIPAIKYAPTEIRTERDYVITVTESNSNWYGKTNYYIETKGGAIYETTLTGIEPNGEYYFKISKSGRIQEFTEIELP